jgi:hypothetical protein
MPMKVENIFKGGGGGGDAQNPVWATILPALMAERNSGRGGYGGWGGDCGGLGSGFLGGIVGGLLFNRRGGLFGGDDDCGGGREHDRDTDRHIDDVLVLRDLGEVKAEIQQVGSDLKGAVSAATAAAMESTLQQTIQLGQAIGAQTLSNQQGFCQVERTVTNTGTVLLQALNTLNNNVSEQGCQTRAAVSNDGDKTRAMLFSRFQLEDSTRINELNARVVELQAEGRRQADNADLRLSITNTNTATAAQQQGQAQAQQQFQTEALRAIIATLSGVAQSAHATNNLVNTGFMNRSGRQDANPTNVST